MTTDRYGWLRVLAYLCLLFFGMLSVSAQGQTHSYCPTDGNCAYAGTQTMNNGLSVNAPGVFTNGQMNEITPFLINSCSPLTEYQAFQGGGAFLTDGFTLCIAAPVGSTTPIANAVSGYANTSSASTTVVGVSGYGRAIANNSNAYGADFLAGDNASTVGAGVNGVEVGLKINGSPSSVAGLTILATGNGVMPANNTGLLVQSLNSAAWTNSVLISNAKAATVSTTNVPGSTIWQSNYWNGSATAADNMQLSVVAGTGANPQINYEWQHPTGTSGLTLWGPQSPLNFAVFSTTGGVTYFPLASPNAGGFGSIAIPNNLGGATTMAVSGGSQAVSFGSVTTPTIINTGTLTVPTATGTLADVIASGTSTFTTTSVGAGACQTTVTTAATNALTTDTIVWAYATAPTAATDGVLHILPYVTANNVNFMRCNASAGSITPTALVINWKVIR